MSLCLGISLGATLHFRWDSFSIHFSDLPKDPSPDKLSVLFVGDSITCEGARPRGFITKIRSVLPIEHLVVCQKGATSVEILDLVEQTASRLDPAFIIAQSGINDFLNGSTQDQVFRSQEKLSEKLATKFPLVKSILSADPSLEIGKWNHFGVPPPYTCQFPRLVGRPIVFYTRFPRG